MGFPKISIVTPSYNQSEFIEETIESVLTQGYPNLEYIIIDGGSTDGSVEIIKKYDKHLTYWESEKDRGHANALNKGFAKSTGEVMAWINSDDKYLPGAFKAIGEIYAQFPDIEWTMGLYANFDREGVLMSGANNVRAVYKNIYSYIFNDLHIQQESVFWRRSLWEKSGSFISEDVTLMIDTELWCRYFLLTELWHIDQVIGGYRTYGINRSHVQLEAVEEDIENSIHNMILNLPENKKELLEKIKQYQAENKISQQYASEVSSAVRQNKILQLLPHMLYDKVCNYMYRKKIKSIGVSQPLMPSDESMIFRKLVKTNQGWEKFNLPYQFPY